MKPKLYKLLVAALNLTCILPVAAQTTVGDKTTLEVKLPEMTAGLKGLDTKLSMTMVMALGNRDAAKIAIIPTEDITSAWSSQDQNQELQKAYTEKSRRIIKSYKVNSRDKLSIINEYGRIAVNVWPKNEIRVDVAVKAFESSESKAEGLLDNVTIADSKQGDLINFKTQINRDKSEGWWGIKRIKGKPEEKRGVEVIYTIYMPASNPLAIKSSFGSVILPDFDGPVNLEITNGSLKAQNLSNAGNQINVSYGSADIQQIASGNVNVSYGSLKIQSAEKLTAKVHAGSTQIGTLSKGASLNVQMGSCKIEKIEADTRKLDILADKSSLTLGIDPTSVFNFDVTVILGGFKYEQEKVTLVKQEQDDDDRNFRPDKARSYKGKYGTGSTNSQYTIKSSYGSVKFL